MELSLISALFSRRKHENDYMAEYVDIWLWNVMGRRRIDEGLGNGGTDRYASHPLHSYI